MTSEHSEIPGSAEELYRNGLEKNWRGSGEGMDAALARAMFERSASMGHVGGIRELAEMMFVGSGGSSEPERALLLKLQAARRGSVEALDELAAMLAEYSEQQVRQLDREKASAAALKAEEAHARIRWLENYLNGLAVDPHKSIGQT